MSDFKISQLRLLAQIMQTGSLTDAARNLGMTASTASRTLKRLQEELNDPLFIRTWRGMVPTERSASIMPVIQNLLTELEHLHDKAVFDPSKLEMTLTIGAADNAIVGILVPVIRAISRQAPGITFRILPLDNRQFDRLAEGELDFLLYPTHSLPQLPAHFNSLTLFRIQRSVLVASNHPLAIKHRSGEDITTEELEAFPRIVVKLNDSSRGVIFNVNLSAQKRPAIIEVPYFLGAPYFLEGTQNTLILPRNTAEFFAKNLPNLTAIPWATPSNENNTRLIWHERTDRSPHMQWIRSLFREHSGSDPSFNTVVLPPRTPDLTSHP